MLSQSAPSREYADALESVAPNITTLVAERTEPGESWIDTLQRLLPVVAATYQQKQILDIQVERARQGLPPLNANQVAAGVNVGIDPQTQKMLMIFGGLALGFGLLALFAPRPRRG
jgi:hypothetical protein